MSAVQGNWEVRYYKDPDPTVDLNAQEDNLIDELDREFGNPLCELLRVLEPAARTRDDCMIANYWKAALACGLGWCLFCSEVDGLEDARGILDLKLVSYDDPFNEQLQVCKMIGIAACASLGVYFGRQAIRGEEYEAMQENAKAFEDSIKSLCSIQNREKLSDLSVRIKLHVIARWNDKRRKDEREKSESQPWEDGPKIEHYEEFRLSKRVKILDTLLQEALHEFKGSIAKGSQEEVNPSYRLLMIARSWDNLHGDRVRKQMRDGCRKPKED